MSKESIASIVGGWLKAFVSQYYLTLSLFLLCILLFVVPNSAELFAFNRLLVLEQHQWWRVFTTFFIHTSTDHLTYNLITLVSSSLVCETLSRKVFFWYLLVAFVGFTIFHFFAYSEEIFILGFSGVAAGNFCVLLLLMCKQLVQQKQAYFVVAPATILVLFIVYELGLLVDSTPWEFFTGSSLSGGQGQTVKQAHVFGIILGVLVSVSAIVFDYMRAKKRLV